MSSGIMKNQKLEKKRQYLLKEGRFEELGMLTLNTNHEELIHQIIQDLYQRKQYAVLNTIYLMSSENDIQRRNCLLQLYEKECPKLQRKVATLSKEEYSTYEDLFKMMVMHTLSTPKDTPSYGSLLVDLLLKVSSSSTLISLTPLILNNYPDKKEAIRTGLLAHNNLFHLYQFSQLSESIDLELISYLFHSIEWVYEEMQMKEYDQHKQVKDQVTLMYHKLKQRVMQYNQDRLDRIKDQWEISGFQIKDLKNPENPILSLLDIAPISEEDKNQLLFDTPCDKEFQQELLKAFYQRNHDKDQMKCLDFYYVLYHDPIQKEKWKEKEEQIFSKIQAHNLEYLLQIERQLYIGQINEEDVIGAICGQKARPIFGLFSYLTRLPLEDLLSIASNIVFEEPMMMEQLISYIKQEKEGIQSYDATIQALDVQYVKSKQKYQKRKED